MFHDLITQCTHKQQLSKAISGDNHSKSRKPIDGDPQTYSGAHKVFGQNSDVDITVLQAEQPSDDKDTEPYEEEDAHWKAKKDFMKLISDHTDKSRTSTCECISRIVAAVVLLCLVLLFMIITLQ